jgi:hypothetical protein
MAQAIAKYPSINLYSLWKILIKFHQPWQSNTHQHRRMLAMRKWTVGLLCKSDQKALPKYLDKLVALKLLSQLILRAMSESVLHALTH